MNLDFKLHTKQMEILTSLAKFKVCAAGRRGGKTYLAAVLLLVEGLKDKNESGYNLKSKEVWYIAPTFQQAKDIMWDMLKDMGKDVITKTYENTATITLINGRKIQLKGSDRPDTLRGSGNSYIVMDEYAFMKPEVWDVIIQPTLADVNGDALFIGTPEGKNHFYDLWLEAQDREEWEAFTFNSTDNPTLDPKVIEAARERMSVDAFRQEFEASFSSSGGGAFKEKDVQYADKTPFEGITYIAVDPAGYSDGDGMIKSNLKRLDEMAIAVVEVAPEGWFVKDIISGRWGVREASLQIIMAAQKYKPAAVGIEGGSLKNAIMPYLEDQMRRLNIYPRIEPLTHGGKKKTERILWSLQGRFQHGRITLKTAGWNKKFVEQLLDFPNPMAHDDLLDALAYIDQISSSIYENEIGYDSWEPLDSLVGY
jgi:predicted phage terminase large subunit-like protein